jgi:hypothetical protein
VKDFLNNLKRQAQENPVMTFIVVSTCLTIFGKLLDSIGRYRGSSAYARDVDRRIRNAR